jgi:phosphoglycerate dehydrogenase-like enzyme
VTGKLVAIVGVGEVGHHLAKVCKFHGMNVAAMSRSLTPEEGRKRGYDEVFGREDLRDVAGRADAIVLCVPHTPQTEGMIDRDIIQAIRPTSVLINIARGKVIDEPAMIDALRSGSIGLAALDVTAVEPLPDDSPLWDLPNVMISPHSASTVKEENERITDIFIHNMNCMLDGHEENMRNLFDMKGMY